MKKITKIMVNLLVAILLATTCFGLVGCSKEDIKTVELTVSVFNYETNTWYDEDETKITIDLYRHLAPNTVDAIVSYVEEGYYDDTLFYTMGGSLNKIMVGDLKVNDRGDIVQNAIKPQIQGEFEHGGTIGSNLSVAKGNVALWRTWNAHDNSYNTSRDVHTGRATWFMPTEAISSYDGWFCVFAVIDMEKTENANTWEYVKNAVTKDANTEEYTVYYTGEYDSEKPDENHGLTFNCEDDVNLSSVSDLFKAETEEYVCYNNYKIKVANAGTGRNYGAKIVSAKII